MAPNRHSRIPVFLKGQNPYSDLTNHSASKSLALLVVAAVAAKPILRGPQLIAIHLQTMESWKEVKFRVRPCITSHRSASIPFTQDSGFDHPWSWHP